MALRGRSPFPRADVQRGTSRSRERQTTWGGSGRRGGGGVRNASLRGGRAGSGELSGGLSRRPVPGGLCPEAWRIHGGPPPRPSAHTGRSHHHHHRHRHRLRPSACPGRGGRPDGNRQPQDGSRRPGSRTTESRGPGSRSPGRSWTGTRRAGRSAATVSGAGRPRACRGGRLQVFSGCPLADGAGGGHQHADGALGVLFGQGEQFAAVAGERGVHLAAGVGQVAALAQECGDVLLAQHDGLP